jgi:prophage regulatory protein
MATVILRRRVVEARTGKNTSDIYDGMRDGTFPRAVPIGPRAVGWVEDEIDDWIKERIALRDARLAAERAALRDPQLVKRRGGPGRGRKGPLALATSDNEEAEPG